MPARRLPARRVLDKLPDAFVLSLVVVVSGCASAAPPRPVEVSLDRSALEMRLSDARICAAPVTAVPGRYTTTVTGTGDFPACPGFAYTVTGDPGTNPLRFVLEEGLAALGLPDGIAPMATVEIAAPDGRTWTFASPPGTDDD
ncbi:MAG: hypothetical protein ACOCY0_00855 [Roseicyclus sp.]